MLIYINIAIKNIQNGEYSHDWVEFDDGGAIIQDLLLSLVLIILKSPS